MMNKCCVKNIQCTYATSYGVCKLSSLYDCKPIDEVYCNHCKKPILDGDECFESDDTVLCEECGVKDFYLDDEITDLEKFKKIKVKS